MAGFEGMKFKLSWLRAIEYFLLGYLLSTVLAFTGWIIFPVVSFILWAVRMAVMPVFFYYLTRLYLRRTPSRTFEGRRLAIFWTILLVLFDLAIFKFIVKFSFVDVYIKSEPWLLVGYFLSFVAPVLAEARHIKLGKSS